jgi:hypothetical protein
LCRVAEKPAAKSFTALIFWFFCIKAKEQTEFSWWNEFQKKVGLGYDFSAKNELFSGCKN